MREDFTEAVEVWNEAADEAGLPKIQRLTEPRARALKARLAECGGIEGWRAVIGKVRDSPFLRGNNPNGWKADFDFVLQAKSFTKLMEGSYDGHRSKPASPAQKSNLELLYEAVNGPGREIGNEVW